MSIPKNQLCDSGCGNNAKFFSKATGRYRCLKSANSCPANRAKNSAGIKQAHVDGRVAAFTDKHRKKSHISHRRKLIESKSFEELGQILRKKIVLEDQDYKCDNCGLSRWLDVDLVLELDHIDGNRENDLRKNLRCLCPNCHSITDTYRGRNKNTGTTIISDDKLIESYYQNNRNIRQTLLDVGLAPKGGNYARVKKLCESDGNR